MKVAFISRSTLYEMPGGDTKQIEMTARYLRKEGVIVDIFLCNQKVDYDKYDLLHLFNIIRPADFLNHVKKTKTKVVISSIFVQYGEYERKKRRGIRGWFTRFLPEDGMEFIKAIARWIKGKDVLVSKSYLLFGHKRSVKNLLKRCSLLLPNSHNEYLRLFRKYNIKVPYAVIPNGIDTELTNKKFDVLDQYKDSIICIARIEELKNQLSLIKALNGTNYKLFIHGKPGSNHSKYYEDCLSNAASNVSILPWLEADELFAVYRSAKVHVLPSYFETTGLSSLEAAVMGCNIVVTDKGDTRDYFDKDAWYCDPDDIDSIKKAVDEAFNAPFNPAFRQKILCHYTWEIAAKKTLAAYQSLIE